MGTIYDVAAEARVSISTVSRVFQGNEQVGEELRRRVLKAAERLGYQPNTLARALAQGRSNAFGVILPVGLANPYYGTMLERICSSAYRHGFETVVSVPRDWSVEAFLQAAASLERRMIDGLILFTSARFAEAYRETRTPSSPPVVVVGALRGVELPLVTPDEEMGGYEATRHLLSLGHRRVAFLCLAERGARVHGRESGYLRAMAEHGAEPVTVTGYADMAQGREKALALMESHPDVTAIVAHNDDAALGALRALSELGIPSPGRVSVSGFDNVPLAQYACPALTTVDYPVEDLSFLAVELLQAFISGKREDESPTQLLVQPRLIVRESTGPPPSRD